MGNATQQAPGKKATQGTLAPSPRLSNTILAIFCYVTFLHFRYFYWLAKKPRYVDSG